MCCLWMRAHIQTEIRDSCLSAVCTSVGSMATRLGRAYTGYRRTHALHSRIRISYKFIENCSEMLLGCRKSLNVFIKFFGIWCWSRCFPAPLLSNWFILWRHTTIAATSALETKTTTNATQWMIYKTMFGQFCIAMRKNDMMWQ